MHTAKKVGPSDQQQQPCGTGSASSQARSLWLLGVRAAGLGLGSATFLLAGDVLLFSQ